MLFPVEPELGVLGPVLLGAISCQHVESKKEADREGTELSSEDTKSSCY